MLGSAQQPIACPGVHLISCSLATYCPGWNAMQAAGAATAGAAAELAAADRGDKEGLHRLAWLAEQRPLVEQRLAAVHGRVAGPAASAVAALQALLDGIEASKQPLMEVVAGRDEAVTTLLGELALEALVGAANRGL